MAKYCINDGIINNSYPYDIVSKELWMNGVFLELCYTTGIPNTEEYGKMEVLEIYFYKNSKPETSHHRAMAYSSRTNTMDRIPEKYLDILMELKDEHKKVFGVSV